MHFVKAAIATGLAAVEDNIDVKFIRHVIDHNLSYKTIEEFNARKALFTEVENFIKEENAKPENTYKVGHNKFSTWTR
jgi:hypothetical protein